MRGSKNQNPKNLEKIRRAAGLSRTKLSELSGVNKRTIEAYEQGKNDINFAAVNIVRSLAKSLNVSIEEIIEDVE